MVRTGNQTISERTGHHVLKIVSVPIAIWQLVAKVLNQFGAMMNSHQLHAKANAKYRHLRGCIKLCE
jgi:hypothetical protein